MEEAVSCPFILCLPGHCFTQQQDILAPKEFPGVWVWGKGVTITWKKRGEACSNQQTLFELNRIPLQRLWPPCLLPQSVQVVGFLIGKDQPCCGVLPSDSGRASLLPQHSTPAIPQGRGHCTCRSCVKHPKGPRGWPLLESPTLLAA